MNDWMTTEMFDEVVKNMNTMGEIKTKVYLARLNKPGSHLLVWKAKYEKGDEDTLLSCFDIASSCESGNFYEVLDDWGKFG